jgi:glycosyltransferase involved in cell wall biosynthesis
MEMKNKGLGVVENACRGLWARRNDFRLCIASNCRIADQPFVERIPWHPHEQVHRIYHEKTALIVPSLLPDAFPIVVLEAMASGLPVIGSRVGGIPEQIEDGRSGLLFTPGEAGELEQRIEFLLQNPARGKAMGEAARKRATEEFSMEHVFDRHYRTLFPV